MKEAISTYIQEAYGPKAIVLYGSRASGGSRTHSDWDFILLLDRQPAEREWRDEVLGQDLDFRAFETPVPTERINHLFKGQLLDAEILLDHEGSALSLLQIANSEARKGRRPTDREIDQQRAYVRHKIAGLIDDEGEPHLFFRHRAVLHSILTKLWSEIIRNEYPRPLYVTIPVMRDLDSSYSNDLAILATSINTKDVINSAQRMFERLFKVPFTL